MGRHRIRKLTPEEGKLYKAVKAFQFRIDTGEFQPWNAGFRFVSAGTVFMLLKVGKSMGKHAYNHRREWMPNDGYDVAGTVYLCSILHSGKIWDVGFREDDWGHNLKLFKPRRLR